MFLTSCLLKYDLIEYLELEDETSVPMVLFGDFRLSEDDSDKMKQYILHLKVTNVLVIVTIHQLHLITHLSEYIWNLWCN